MASITAIEKGLKTFATRLRKRGVEVEVEIFRSGHWANSEASYGEITCQQEVWEDGDLVSRYLSVKWIANGYAGTTWTELAGDTITELRGQTVDLMVREWFSLVVLPKERWVQQDQED